MRQIEEFDRKSIMLIENRYLNNEATIWNNRVKLYSSYIPNAKKFIILIMKN